MTIITTTLARDRTGEWQLGFEFADCNTLFVRFKPHDAAPGDRLEAYAMDDFLAWRPRDALHAKAIENCAQWFARSLERSRKD